MSSYDFVILILDVTQKVGLDLLQFSQDNRCELESRSATLQFLSQSS